VNFLSKIMFGIIICILLSWLISLSFLSSDYSKIEEINTKNIETWLFDLRGDSDNLSLIKINSIWESQNILTEKLSIWDTLYSSGWTYTKTLSWSTTFLQLNSGIFLFHFNELYNKYNISWEWFELQNAWPWIFLINFLKPGNVLIFPLNTQLHLSLIDIETGGKATSLDLYPHTYISIKPKRNKLLHNVDLLKISQSFILEYFNEPLNSKENTINPTFLSTLSSNESEYSFLRNTFHYILWEYQKSNQEIQYFSDAVFSPFPGEIYIKKYYELLLNDEKKQTYNKNLILKSLYKILNENNGISESIDFISTTMLHFKKNNPDEYKKMIWIIYFYYKNILFISSEDNSHILNFSHLYSGLNDKKTSYIAPSILSLRNTFLSYDIDQSNNFYNNLNKFLKKYEKDGNIKSNDSFLFFLEQILVKNFRNENTNTNELILFFNNYVKISETYYNTTNLTILHTWLKINSEILKSFTYIIKNNFFEEARTREWLLKTLNTKNNKYENFSLLQKNIIKLIKFYNVNKNILDPENNFEKSLIDDYVELQLIFDEYFLALNDYKAYTIKYDSRFQIDNTNEDNKANQLTKAKALNFLWTFQWLLFTETVIELKKYNYCQNPQIEELSINDSWEYECYKINNLNIWKEKFSFLLHPYNGNKINNITFEKNGILDEKKWSYDLDDMKESLEQKYKAADSSEKDQYDFKRFFLNNFIKSENSPVLTVDDDDDDIDVWIDDKYTRYFKRNKLLGDNWDFTKIAWFFHVIYNNIRMTQQDISENNNYNIQLSWTNFWINIKENDKVIKYNWVFNSYYTYDPSHSFSKINFKLLDLKAKEKKWYLLSWNSVYIVWDVPLMSLQKNLSFILNEIKIISEIILNIDTTLNENNIEIYYIVETWNFEFKTNYENKNIKIVMNQGKIIELNVNGEKIIDFIFHYSKLNDFLTNIK